MTVVHDGALHDVLEGRDLVPSLNWFVGGFLNGDFSDTETSGTISKVWYAHIGKWDKWELTSLLLQRPFFKLWEQTELLAV